MPRETPSPIDLPAPPLDAPGLGWAATAIVTATLVLLAINAVALRDWAEDLTPSPAQARIAAAAEQWVTITDATGLGAVRGWLHERWKAVEAAHFGTA
jgi:hypothetical protein